MVGPTATALSTDASVHANQPLTREFTAAMAASVCYPSFCVRPTFKLEPKCNPGFAEIEEFEEKIGDIDRSEQRTGFFRAVDGDFVLDPTPEELPDWNMERQCQREPTRDCPCGLSDIGLRCRALHTARVRACAENGGCIMAAFVRQTTGHQAMVGVVVLDGKVIGAARDTLDMYFLFATRGLRAKYLEAGAASRDFRGAGLRVGSHAGKHVPCEG